MDGQSIGQDIPIPSGNTSIKGFRILPGGTATQGEMWVDDLHFAVEGSAAITQGVSSSVFQKALPETPEGARAYPSPYKPGRGTSGITLDRLPAQTMIHVYSSLDGRLTKTLISDSSGKVHWDITNDSNQPVASGVYVVVFELNGVRKTVKLIVQN